MPHPSAQQALLNAGFAIGEEHPQPGVIQPLAQILPDALPRCVDPKAHRLKVFALALRGQRPAHLRLAEVFSLFPLQMHLSAVHQQPNKGALLEVSKRRMAAGKLLQPAVNRTVAHRLPADALNLLSRAPVGDMHAKTDPRLQRLIQKPHLLGDRQGLHQRRQAAAGFTILDLGEPIRKIAHRTTELARLALMAVFTVALRVFFNLPETDCSSMASSSVVIIVSRISGAASFSPTTRPLIVSFALGIVNTKRRSIAISPNGFLLFLRVAQI